MSEELERKEKDPTVEELLKGMEDLKKNTVPKEKYEKLEQQNVALVKQITEGGSGDKQSQPEEISDDELLKRIFNQNGRSNLEKWTDTLEYRKRKLAKNEPDPFISPQTERHTPDASSYAAAEKVASEIGECIKIADGDSAIFDVELGRRLNQPPNLPFK